MSLLPIYFLIIFSITTCRADTFDMQVTSGNIYKFLRAMTNDTKGGDSLNLPANATSIRENIVDTFSCENRTYGYYADVDNECQVFHVCLPSQTPSGRNITYRWSFICPNETVFNQEVLVCTRPRDAIPCEESPMYFDLNMDLGRLPEDNKEELESSTASQASKHSKIKKITNKAPVRKQNLVVQNLLEEVVEEEMEKVDEELGNTADEGLTDEIVPVIVDVDLKPDAGIEVESSEVDGRILEERSLWKDRKLRRGFRFKADV